MSPPSFVRVPFLIERDSPCLWTPPAMSGSGGGRQPIGHPFDLAAVRRTSRPEMGLDTLMQCIFVVVNSALIDQPYQQSKHCLLMS